MKIKPIDHKYGKPKPYPISFGIYKERIATNYGYKQIGLYKDKIIMIHNDIKENTKMFYVTDKLKKWLKSKLIFFQWGEKKVIISENKC